MPVPSLITDLSQTASSNYPQGSDSPSTLDDVQRAVSSFVAMLRDGKGFTNAVTLASATTTDIGGQNALSVEISGTTTITSFGTSYNGPRFIRFTGALTLTHSSTILILPTAANITTAAGDTAIAIPTQAGTGWAVISYTRASGAALSATDYLNTTRIDVASASTVDLTTNAPNTRHIRITGTTAITAFTIAAGLCYFVTFSGALTLTNSAGLVTNTAANITTAAGDTCIIRATAANTVEILAYSTAFRAALASTAEVQAGTDTLKTVTPATMQAGKIIQGTAVATTSGTTVDFTGIPTWAKRVTLLFNGVSTNGTNNLLVQIGSGSIQTSGYLGTAERMTGAVAIGSFTTGFGILSVNNTTTIRGQMTVLSFGSNTWIASHTLGDEGSNNNYVGAGSVTLSGALDRIRLTSVGGTDTFDAGSVNVIWE